MSIIEDTILQMMLSMDDKEDRRFAIEKIVKNRERQGHPRFGDCGPEPRKNPKVNFDAKPLTFRNVISWDRVFREPALTSRLTTEQLYKYLDEKMVVPYIPNHTQSVERLVKRVTEAGHHVSTEDKRDGVILAQLEACDILPRKESKRDLLQLIEYRDSYRKKPRRD